MEQQQTLVTVPETTKRVVRRYTDKRRYTSRIAARERRSIESYLLQDLGGTLPISKFTLDSLDKISILRLAVANLKLRALFGNRRQRRVPSKLELDDLLHGGFLVVISSCGDVIFVSEGISECLGLATHEVIGKNMYEVAHPKDRANLNQLLASPPDSDAITDRIHRSGLVRLKCNLFPDINPIHFRPVGEKVIHFAGNMYKQMPAGVSPNSRLGSCFIGVGRTIPHPADSDFPYHSAGSRMFTSFHSIKDMAFVQADQRVEQLLGFTPEEMLHRKGLDLVHCADFTHMVPKFIDLFTQGQIQTEPFRLVCKGGGWVWVISEASTLFTSTYRANTLCPASAVFCRHMVISDIETSEIISLDQVPEGHISPSPSSPEPEPDFMDTSESESAPASNWNIPAADLLQELLQSNSNSSFCHPDTNSDGGNDWQLVTTNYSTPTLPPNDVAVSSPIPNFEHFDDLSFLRMLTDVDFSSLPEFAEVLNTLFVEEVTSPPTTDGQDWSELLDLVQLEPMAITSSHSQYQKRKGTNSVCEGLDCLDLHGKMVEGNDESPTLME